MTLSEECHQLMDQLQLSSRRIVLLAGGSSQEREISLRSGQGVFEALSRCALQIEQIDPAEISVRSFEWQKHDIAFLALHGCYGEDGQIQQELEQLGVSFTGCQAQVAVNCFDKLICQQIVEGCGVSVPQTLELTAEQPLTQQIDSIGDWGLPAIVKPRRNGSSVGMALISSVQQTEEALITLQPFLSNDSLLVQPLIQGAEWTVPFLDERMLPPVSIQHAQKFFSYSAKYQAPETVFSVVSQDHPHYAAVAKCAIAVQAALKTTGAVRVDVMIDQAGEVYCLEVNNIPGMTPSSTLPLAAKAIGWSYEELCVRILLSGLQDLQ